MARTRLIVLSLVILGLLPMIICSEHVFSWGGFGSKIQDELNANPFLQKERIKLRVVEEKSGYVTIEIYEGDRRLREDVHKGLDIFGNQLELQWGLGDASERSRASLNAVRKAIDYVKKMEGVKEVLVNAAVNTPLDHAMDLTGQADILYWKKKYAEAVALYREAAEIGYAIAQSRLGGAYQYGIGASQDYSAAINWYRKAADQGDVEAMNALSWLFATCKDAKVRDGAKAVSYARKAISQAPDNPFVLDTLAAAYARNNQFQEAVMTEEKAISLLTNRRDLSDEARRKHLPGFQKALSLYKNRQAYIEE